MFHPDLIRKSDLAQTISKYTFFTYQIHEALHLSEEEQQSVTELISKITKEYSFSASHQLKDLPETHQCARLHEHNYVVRVELASATLNSHGFVRDYQELAPLKAYIDDALDHRHLNDVLGDASS